MTNEEDNSDLESMLDRVEQSTHAEAQAPRDHKADDYLSPTIESLEPKRRPKPTPLCAACPHSLWFASPEELKCYCRLMHVVTWSPEQASSPILTCDGPLQLSPE